MLDRNHTKEYITINRQLAGREKVVNEKRLIRFKAFVVLIIFVSCAASLCQHLPHHGTVRQSTTGYEIMIMPKNRSVPEKCWGIQKTASAEQLASLQLICIKLRRKEIKHGGNPPFTDSKFEVVTALLVVKGKGDGLFDPDNTVTREK